MARPYARRNGMEGVGAAISGLRTSTACAANCRDWSRLLRLSETRALVINPTPSPMAVASDWSPSFRNLARTSTASDSAFPLSSSLDWVRSAAP